MQKIFYFSGNAVVTLSPGLDILEGIGMSLLTFIYFDCYMLVLLSDKLADDIVPY